MKIKEHTWLDRGPNHYLVDQFGEIVETLSVGCEGICSWGNRQFTNIDSAKKAAEFKRGLYRDKDGNIVWRPYL